MSGTAISKALLVDPKGKSFIVTVGTKVGNRGGKVAAISATEVRIEEPARPPVVKALELPSTEMERELQSVQEF
jgi:Tfp pilus assembly protein PilP